MEGSAVLCLGIFEHLALKITDDLAASFFRNTGIDPKTEFQTNVGRPVTLVRNGSVIESLFA